MFPHVMSVASLKGCLEKRSIELKIYRAGFKKSIQYIRTHVLQLYSHILVNLLEEFNNNYIKRLICSNFNKKKFISYSYLLSDLYNVMLTLVRNLCGKCNIELFIYIQQAFK